MRVLLHVCCAACAIEPAEELARNGHRVHGFFSNPNIHPFIEFRRRLKALKVLQERLPLPVTYQEDYGLPDWLAAVRWAAPAAERCADCYRLRLARTAETAARGGYEAFATTLLSSTHQDHSVIRAIGEECARTHGVAFLAQDWRPLAERGHERARRMRLYLQNYCGCVFSEWERFRDTALHVYRGQGPAADTPEVS
ncbi:MAG: epoxyqueuosine reductase QueH [Candidatus Brocadiaceae bacterium]|nr:epoxyqueuosine reductase QueH [Candidatus Brocadiaceae bacterium]